MDGSRLRLRASSFPLSIPLPWISMSLPQYPIDGLMFDSLDLKVMLLGQGVYVHDSVYDHFGKTHRISRNPRACNTIFLEDHLPVYLARTGPQARFHLLVREEKAVLESNGDFITVVAFPKKTDFYTRKTSHGIPFGDLAILQGEDMLAFSYLWPCELAKSGNECRFCHCGNFTSQMVRNHLWKDFEFPVEDIVEVVQYAVETDPKARVLQMTAGSTRDPDAEIDRYTEILREIDRRVGLEKVGGGILFLTPPKNPGNLDRLFEAGIGRVAFDLDIWNETLFEQLCPGKARYTTQKQHLDALHYVAEKYGPNRACSVFVAGLEPIESLLEGETFLARSGIVPLPSPWTPIGVENPNLPEVPGVDYYRTLIRETARLYTQYNLEAPGTVGSSVCLSRDIWLRKEILANRE